MQRRKFNYIGPTCVPSKAIRLPWYDKPTYASRKEVRQMATQAETYELCVEKNLVDPLVLYEYFKKMKVFADVDGLPRDKQGMQIAQWQACKALEAHYGLAQGTAWDKRQSKRITNHLSRTSKTPMWMKKWVRPEPKLYNDKPIPTRQEQVLLGLPMSLSQMFAEFDPKNMHRYKKP